LTARYLAIALATGCAMSHGKPILEMSTGCLGMCSQYVVTVYEDGFVHYHGDGRARRTRMTPAQLAKLDRSFARFSSIDRHTINCETTDLGTLYTISYRGTTLSFFDECPKVPEELLSLVGDVRWLLGLEN